jgi:N-acyl-D-aspartate/D-glutamate deacylase
MDLDLLVRGGLVVDGSGLPGYRADVGVKDGRVAEVGHLAGRSAAQVIDADGLVVAPGFIDVHTHFDGQMFWDPYGTSSPQHGVTSVVMGNCGLTLAPVKDEDRDHLISSLVRVEAIPRQVLEEGVPWGWRSFGDYLDALDGNVGINVGGLVGHIALRHYVMGADSLEREATDDEVAGMKALLADSLAGGALGLSTNRNNRHVREDGRPVSSRLASDGEVHALAEVLRDLNTGIVLVSGGPKYAAIDELARHSERPVVWLSVVHHYSNPTRWREQLDNIGATFRDGYRAYAMTHTAPQWSVFNMKNSQRFDEFPTWRNLMFIPDAERKQAMGDPATRAKLADELADPRPTTFHRRWDLVEVTKAARPENQRFRGKNILQVAEMRGQTPLDAFLDLSIEEDLEAEFQTPSSGGDPEATGEILRNPYILAGLSDAGAHVQFRADNGFSTTLLSMWVRDHKVLSLEEAVFKLTFQLASVYGLEGRGLLRPGYHADMAIFDADTVRPCESEWTDDYPAHTRRMIQRSEGLEYTIVNGRVIYHDDRFTGDLPGQILRGSGYRAAVAV